MKVYSHSQINVFALRIESYIKRTIPFDKPTYSVYLGLTETRQLVSSSSCAHWGVSRACPATSLKGLDNLLPITALLYTIFSKPFWFKCSPFTIMPTHSFHSSKLIFLVLCNGYFRKCGRTTLTRSLNFLTSNRTAAFFESTAIVPIPPKKDWIRYKIFVSFWWTSIISLNCTLRPTLTVGALRAVIWKQASASQKPVMNQGAKVALLSVRRMSRPTTPETERDAPIREVWRPAEAGDLWCLKSFIICFWFFRKKLHSSQNVSGPDCCTGAKSPYFHRGFDYILILHLWATYSI